MVTHGDQPAARRNKLLLTWALAVAGGLFGLTPPAYTEDDLLPYQQLKTEVVPIQALFSRVQEKFDGLILEVELDREDRRWIYEVTVLTPRGNVLELSYDAKTMELLEVNGRQDDPQVRRNPDRARP